ncbi:hypothetical protein [Corallococcus sp. 4LFB]|uniref:hypothetical protein n=1 Tax=Corallococcus sp. 4LFB TaxID=3383249 RepID=UPI003976B557
MKRASALVLGLSLSLAPGAFAAGARPAKGAPAAHAKAGAKTKKAKQGASQKAPAAPAEGSSSN